MMKFDFQVTLIIPVYNVDKYLRQCLESVVAQDYDKTKLEVLLINDGSTDDSELICKEYVKKYSFFRLFTKENEGLCRTRNYGINRARGKYLMYLDSDDTLNKEAISSIVKLFEKHYNEIDLVLYKIIPIRDGKQGGVHYRYKYLKQTGIYDLEDYRNIYSTPTNINVCVKNQGTKNIMFDTRKHFYHEDQKYCIEVLQDKKKMGYCNEAIYNYLQQAESIIHTRFYSYNIFESTMLFWEQIFNMYDDNVPQFIQSLYVNDLNWKLMRNILFPYYYEEQLEHAKNRIFNLLDKVNDAVIANHPALDKYYKTYFISKKPSSSLKFYTGYNNYALVNQKKVVFSAKRFEIMMLKTNLKNDTFIMCGVVCSPVFCALEVPKLFININRMEYRFEVELKDSSWGYHKSKEKICNFYCFEYKFETLDKLSDFSFEVEMGEEVYKTYYTLMPTTGFYRRVGRTRIINGDDILYLYKDNVFYHRRISTLSKMKYELATTIKEAKVRPLFAAKRVFFKLFSKKKQEIWLYYDCKGVEKDNGYYQFCHDITVHDDVKRYYIYNNPKSRVYKLFNKKYKKNLIKFGSIQHKILFLRCEKVITAFAEYENRNPFEKNEFLFYSDLHNADLIYLQHGVLHANVPWKYSKDRLLLDKEVVSTHFEVENLIKNYGFNEGDLIKSGMPRYSYIDTDKPSSNRILFAPTWRKELVYEKDNEWHTSVSDDQILDSVFFSKILEFLNSSELEAVLKRSELILDFKLHPIFEKYKELVRISNPRVRVAEGVIDEKEYKIFITDFSSYSFDFAYLKRPIIYFVPDYKQFVSGINVYRELDLPFSEAFGKLITESKLLIEEIKSIVDNNYIPQNKYMERMNNFFIPIRDKDRCDIIYEEIKK